MTRLLLTACATSGCVGEGQNPRSSAATVVANGHGESAVIRYSCLASNGTAPRPVPPSFGFQPCQSEHFFFFFLNSTSSSHEAPTTSARPPRTSNPR